MGTTRSVLVAQISDAVLIGADGITDQRQRLRRQGYLKALLIWFLSPFLLHAMVPPVAPILVAGAGPSGLIAALTLVQNNIPVRIIAKELEHRPGQRGSAIWPRTFEIFHFLRAFEIHQHAKPIPPVREYRPGTLELHKSFTMIPHNDSTPSIPYNSAMFLGQPLLESILRSHLEMYGCSVELGTELLSFKDHGECVLVELVKRKNGEEITETFEASYLIGADGARSVTRKQLGLTFLGETRQDFSCVIGDLRLELEGLDRNYWNFFGSPSSDFFMLRPTDEVAPDGFQFLVAMKEHEPKRLLADRKLLVKCISELTGHELDIREFIAVSEFRPNIRMVDKFGVGRVFVAGDAAHVHSPTGGQGLNSSVQDAFNLAWKLSLTYKGLSPTAILDSYTTERLPVIAEMLSITTGILNNIRSTSTTEDPMMRDKKMSMLGVNCRSSPIVLDEFTQAEPVSTYGVLEEGVLVAGDRAPDAPALALVQAGGAPTETRLFDLFSPTYHTVLVFTQGVASSTNVLEALKKYPGEVIRQVVVLPQGSEVTDGALVDVVVDRDGHAYREYMAVKGEEKIVVVRPDGVVGAMVHGAEGMGQYFSQIFV